MEIEVTEFRRHSTICPCCNTLNKPNLPEPIKSYAQYGNNIKAFVAYLNTYQMLPYSRISELIQDLVSHKISEGTIYNMLKTFYNELELFETKSKELLLNSNVLNVDETGINIGGKLHWIHNVSTDFITYYMVHRKRGKEAIDYMGILPLFKGVAVHDHWKPYQNYDCLHSFCNAHLLRELTSITQNENIRWAKDIHKLLTNMNKYIYKLVKNNKIAPSRGKIQQYYKQYDDICKGALKYYPSSTKLTKGNKRVKQSHSKNLLDRFIKYKDETLRFFINLLVPFTNNLAERDLRMIKVKEKISGCFASFKGAEIFNRIRGYISTVKKNNRAVLEELRNVLSGKAYFPVLIGC